MSQPAPSHTIRALEQRLGLRLLTRTTRSVAPTEAGDRLLRTAGPRLDEIDAELPALSERRDKLSGTIRIAAHDHAVQSVLWPALAKLLSDYREIAVEIVIDYGLTDIVAERYDAGVRSDEMVAKDMVAVRIGPDMRSAVVGAPSYLAGRPRPKTPQDLTNHTCINLRLSTHGGLYAWEFAKGGRDLRVRVRANSCSTAPPRCSTRHWRGSAWRICRRTACARTSPTAGLSACWPIGVRPTPAITSTTPAAANPRRRSHAGQCTALPAVRRDVGG